MKDLKLIEGTNNLELSIFDFQFTSDLSEYVAQKLKIKLSMFQGEWYLNNTAGMPYFQDILISNPNIDLIEDLYKASIRDTYGVSEIVEFNSFFDKSIRKFTVEFTVKLIDNQLLELIV